MDSVGDRFCLVGRIKVEVEVIEVATDGHACKLKAVKPDPYLGRIGFFQEGEDWVTFDLTIVTKN